MKMIPKLYSLKLAALAVAGMCADMAFAQPTISNLYPNGTNMFQPSSTLTFTVNSGPGVTNVVVDLTATNLYTGSVLLSHRTSASGLTIVGSGVSAPLAANSLYGATITAYDANGSTTTSKVFDTINPAYTWEAEDWDHDGGLYFDASAGVNQYANLNSGAGTDYNTPSTPGGSSLYRPKGLETENPNSGDSPLRLAYIGTTNLDYNIGFYRRRPMEQTTPGITR